MRVLVTGVSGQVGGALMPLVQSFATAVPADRTILDLARPAAISAQLDALRPDIIYASISGFGSERLRGHDGRRGDGHGRFTGQV